MIDRRRVEELKPAIAARMVSLRERVDAAGGSGVEILAVSKGQPVEAAAAAIELGLAALGENYAQELAAKAGTLADADIVSTRWHFLGNIQTNKVRGIADLVAVWQSVDRAKVVREIARRAPGAEVLIQVNLADDPNKGGCGFDQVDALIDTAHQAGLGVLGLMGVGTQGDDLATAAGFARLRGVVDRRGLEQCSMGMTGDLEIAVAEGSTMVRIGTDLFGSRISPTDTPHLG